MVRLIYFADRYDIKEYDKMPLPVDLYNSEGAIMARKGQKLPRNRLLNTYIYDEETDGGPMDTLNVNEDISQLIAFMDEADSLDEVGSREVIREKISHTMTDAFTEESAERIDEKLSSIDFEPLPDVKMNLRRNVYQMKEIFQKQLEGNVTKLASSNNQKFSNSIAQYLDTILDRNLYASDYMDMVNSVRTPENYLTFSHSCSVAFYALSITKKLQILKEDLFDSYDPGKWLPMKTAKHLTETEPLLLSNRLLRYIDHQKEIINIKYSDAVRNVLFEKIHDLMYEYASIDTHKKYPSMQISFDDANRRLIAVAALNHDIGKICIPNSILNKAGRLSREEARTMERHPALSVSKLQELGIENKKLFAYILGHHRLSPERGYPPLRKMPPVESKIIAIADIFDGIRAPKFWGSAGEQEAALSYITSLHEEGCFDLPLYLAAVHTFEEYNHMYVGQRKKQSIDLQQ